MNTTTTRKEIAAGFALAAVTLCVGFYFGAKAGGDGGTALLRIFWLIACLTVLKYTFALGRLRGFPATDEEGRICLGNVVRNLVASAIVLFCVFWISGPFIGLIAQALR